MGSRQIRRLYRALPVFLYCRFKEATPKGIPYPGSRCLAPTGSSLAEPYGYVLVFITVLWILMLPSLALWHTQVNRESTPGRQKFFSRGWYAVSAQ